VLVKKVSIKPLANHSTAVLCSICMHVHYRADMIVMKGSYGRVKPEQT